MPRDAVNRVAGLHLVEVAAVGRDVEVGADDQVGGGGEAIDLGEVREFDAESIGQDGQVVAHLDLVVPAALVAVAAAKGNFGRGDGGGGGKSGVGRESGRDCRGNGKHPAP